MFLVYWLLSMLSFLILSICIPTHLYLSLLQCVHLPLKQFIVNRAFLLSVLSSTVFLKCAYFKLSSLHTFSMVSTFVVLPSLSSRFETCTFYLLGTLFRTWIRKLLSDMSNAMSHNFEWTPSSFMVHLSRSSPTLFKWLCWNSNLSSIFFGATLGTYLSLSHFQASFESPFAWSAVLQVLTS